MSANLATLTELRELLPYLTPPERAEMDLLLTTQESSIEDRPLEYHDLTAYKTHLYKRYKHTPHLELLDRELEQVTRFVESGGVEGTWMLIVSMPPRCGKTLTVSRLYPTWHLGRNPDHRVMLTSYGATLAYKNSRFARTVMQSDKYLKLFGIALNPASRAVDAWDIDEHEGGSDAMGVQGGATGKGAHLLIGDDLIKNRQEAESEVIRNRTWEALNDDLLTRLEPGGAVVLFATRWHEDDPIGRMIKLVQNPENCNGPVRVLNLTAMPETREEVEQDPLHRDLGEALWPERFPTPILKAIRSRIGAYSWASLYKGRPRPAEGGLFKRANFNRIQRVNPEEIIRIVRFWDLAMSGQESADYTVGVLMAETALKDGAKVTIGFEKKGYMSRAGKALASDPRLHTFSFFGYPKDTDKYTNALPLAARVGEQLVDIVESYFTDTFLDELCGFPFAANDDQVDAAAGAYEMLTKGQPIEVTTSRYA
jgi:hypothetical protein